MATRIGSLGQLLPGIEAKLVNVTAIERRGVPHVRARISCWAICDTTTQRAAAASFGSR